MTTPRLFLTTLISSALCAIPLLSADAQTAFGVTGSNKLVIFDLSAPATFLTTRSITGLRGGDGVTLDPFGSLFELAFNQQNGRLYGLDGHANLYVINADTGAATLIGSTFSPAGFDGGLAFDPFTSGFRFVSDDGENVRLGLDGSVTIGGTVFYGSGDVNATAAASFAALGIDPDFGTGYALDANLNTLSMTLDPNFREFFTVGSLGFDFTSYASLEVDGLGNIYAALSQDSFTSSIYRIDSSTGAATKLGDVSEGLNAIAVPEPSTAITMLGGVALLLGIRRSCNIR